MPLKNLKKVLVIGSGPIIIGQAAEFDYSGSQALKALKEEGIASVLINSNPATIQTDPEMADAVYIEPLTIETVEKVIEKEQPDGVFSGLGGQTGLNMVSDLGEKGVLEKHNIEVLGTPIETIIASEDREGFKRTMQRIKEPIPKSKTVNSVENSLATAEELGYPVVVRPAYTMGGTGGGITRDKYELAEVAERGLSFSRINQVLIEECVEGWKEIEFEVMRDVEDNCISICDMENIDPMGIHTGDSVVVAPCQTLKKEEYDMLKKASMKIIKALGVEGGCNIQFALKPNGSEYRVIEVNPRVSRSSALASKATGYPIAFITAKLALGRTLSEVQNNPPGKFFEPCVKYVVAKFPKWPFKKFRTADCTLGTEMRATGETMSIGSTFEEALEKAIRSLDIGKKSFEGTGDKDLKSIRRNLTTATHERIFYIADAFEAGMSIEEIIEITKINKWFIQKMKKLWKKQKKKQVGYLPVDTCVEAFDMKTPYYSSEGAENKSIRSEKKSVIILGSGPIRIGQGIEFDYCTVHAVWALKEEGIETIVINNNPETVSTDYDTSDKLYFEPIDFESVMSIVDNEKPLGVITQFGGQTAVNLSLPLKKAGVKVLGTTPIDMDLSEDRDKFSKILKKLGIPQAENGIAYNLEDAKKIVEKIDYPVLVRPSYVLGGRAMEIVHDEADLELYIKEAVQVSENHPILIDKFLQNAIEVDVDCVCDGEDVLIGGVMEHIEQAGVHSGDSSCVVPPQTLSEEVVEKIKEHTRKLALEMKVIGLLNMQYAIKDDTVYVLEANPRSSRTIPFISKAAGIPLAKIAAKVILGKKLKELGYEEKTPKHVSVKSVVFPFNKIPGSDARLGPEMKSTGESMGIADNFAEAYYKAQLGAGVKLPETGRVFFAVNEKDKDDAVKLARGFNDIGFTLLAVGRTSKIIRLGGVPNKKVLKCSEGSPNVVDMINNGSVNLVINTPTRGGMAKKDGYKIRRACILKNVPCITTLAGANAALGALKKSREKEFGVKDLKAYYKEQNK